MLDRRNPYMEISIMQQRTGMINDRLCVGIDLHKDTLTAAVLDPRNGEVEFTKLSCRCREQIKDFFASLPRPNVVAIEAVGFYRWLWNLLEPVVDQLVLADATQCRALAGRRIKTDREDAMNVAELLVAGRLPVAWAPPSHVAELRDVTRHRHYLSQQHARVLHRVKSIMHQVNRPGPARLKAPGLIRYLKGQRHLLPDHLVEQLEMAIDELVLLERQLDRIDQRLKVMLQKPAFQQQANHLVTFPGVALVIAATIIAEVGDFRRFSHRNGITRFAGLNPRTFSSAETTRTGRIAKAGSTDLRWALVQAAWVAVRCDPVIKAFWLRRRKRMGGKRAIIAVARHLLHQMRAACRDGQDYRQAA